ncbi:hypothetical protein Bca4012_055199 [Brassica carinata]|uniref:Uncharacterized protein n=1 Tax=Brassica carinata TaxID=52824 RepID=A0A8X7VVC4_BRACI|nr:hypothetical protein Bca52824_011812 [Brassica carinata]
MLSSSSLADDVSSANPDGVLPAFFLCTDESDSFVHLSLKNPSVARGIAPGLMSPGPPEPPDSPDLGSVMVESNFVTVSFEYDVSSSMYA